jgi:hypothetical protein
MTGAGFHRQPQLAIHRAQFSSSPDALVGAFFLSVARMRQQVPEVRQHGGDGRRHPKPLPPSPGGRAFLKPPAVGVGFRPNMSLTEIIREGANMVTPKNGVRSVDPIGRQKRFTARVPGGKTGTKAATSSDRRGGTTDMRCCRLGNLSHRTHSREHRVMRHDGQNRPHHAPF